MNRVDVNFFQGSATPVDAPPGARAAANPWPRYLGVWAALVAAILAVLAQDTYHLVTRWWNNDTYGHCLLIPPILAWLVWQRREGLAKLAPRPWLPGAGLMLAAGLVWLVGELAGVALFRHAAIVFMIQASVPTVFGLAVTRGVTFPLFFALFMIPVGEQLEPYLQTITARFCMVLLDWFNVPAYLDGVFISIPNGDFEVAEACSGVRFLIAMVAFGALVSNVCFKSWRRRIAFMAAAIILPIIANGIRAWGTIYIAHLTTPEFARGVDHVVYGWVFFAFVMALLLAVGWRFFDRPVDDPFIDPARLQPAGVAPGNLRRLVTVAAAAFALAAAAPAFAALTAAASPDRPTAAVALAAPPGWAPAPYSGLPWRPVYQGATAQAFGTFVDAAGQPVDVYVAVYDQQREGAELIGYGNGFIQAPDEDGWAWAADQRPLAGASVSQINNSRTVREVVQYYWVNDKLVGSPYAAKIEGLKARVTGGNPQAATVIVSAERPDPLVSVRPRLERFLADAGPVDALIARSIVPATGG